MSSVVRRYRRASASAQRVLHDANTDRAPAASQPVAGAAAAEPAKIDVGHQGSSEAAEPAAVALTAVVADAHPQSMGDEGVHILPVDGKPKAEAGREPSVVRVLIDEARGLPEATSGAQP